MKSFLVICLWSIFFSISAFCQKATLTGRLIYDFPPTESDNNLIIEMIGVKTFSTKPNQDDTFSIQNLDSNQSYTLIVRSINPNHNHYYFELTFPIIKKDIIIDIKLRTCGFNVISAQRDIKQKQIKLLLAGGIAPRANTKKDELFEKKYKVQYHEFGCEIPSPENCLRDYNKAVLAFLDKRYGKKWRKKARKDVLFLD